mmetsp:Transcript_28198/g.38600  ORF Transcript_28198/g.38600 Transcript_28198/m.38600 type:complete len:131 (+) Transcript_28198:224-616(+)
MTPTTLPVNPESTRPRAKKRNLPRDEVIETKLSNHFKRKKIVSKPTGVACAILLKQLELSSSGNRLDKQTRLLAHYDEEYQRLHENDRDSPPLLTGAGQDPPPLTLLDPPKTPTMTNHPVPVSTAKQMRT